jgi:hypothetical protein
MTPTKQIEINNLSNTNIYSKQQQQQLTIRVGRKCKHCGHHRRQALHVIASAYETYPSSLFVFAHGSHCTVSLLFITKS